MPDATMSTLDKLNISLGPKVTEGPVTVTAAEPVNDEEANQPDKDPQDAVSVVSDNVQHGVANQQAITLTWTKTSLGFLFVKYDHPFAPGKATSLLTGRCLACGSFTW